MAIIFGGSNTVTIAGGYLDTVNESHTYLIGIDELGFPYWKPWPSKAHTMAGYSSLTDSPTDYMNIYSGSGFYPIGTHSQSAAISYSAAMGQNNQFAHINTNTTTTLSTTLAHLSRVVVNSAGTGSTATIYNSATGSGQVIAVLDTTQAGRVFDFEARCSNGLTVVTAGTTPADLTVLYTN